MTWAFVACALGVPAVLRGAPCAEAVEDLHVDAASGDDGATGSAAAPWATIQHAAESAPPGSTVWVHPGVYRERVDVRVSGSPAAGYTTFRAVTPGTAILDGAELPEPQDGGALLAIRDRSYVRVQGLVLRNHRTTRAARLVVGVLVEGASHHVELRDNLVHAIENLGAGGGDAHGIAVYGRDGTNPVHDLAIDGNEVRDCVLGTSEALVLNGNVTDFAVTRNHVHHNDNIGIDLIGFEGTAPSDDQVRNGVVSDNLVHDITSFGNPGYGDERSAGGVYVDGGRDLVIERNVVTRCDIGIEVASEHGGRVTSGVVVRENLLVRNGVTGLAFGGFSPTRGIARDCRFEHNTLVENDTTVSGTGELLVQKADGNVIRHNVIVCSAQNLLLTSYLGAQHTHDNVFDRNCWYAPCGADAAVVVWNARELRGFERYRSATGEDAASLFADPRLVSGDPAALDARLRADSPCVDAGDPAFVAADGETDLGGLVRVAGARVDLGAHEFGSAPPVPTAPRFTSDASAGGVVGVPFAYVVGVFGTPPISIELTTGTLPDGLVWDDGIIRGTPQTHGVTSLTLTARSDLGTATLDLELRIAPPPGDDTDGDGFPNELEDAYGDGLWDDADDGPLGPGQHALAALDVAQLGVHLDFRRAHRDRLRMRAALSLTADTSLEGREVVVYAGGRIARYVLDAKGRGRDADDGRVRIRVTRSGAAKLSWDLRRTALAATFADDGLVDSTVPAPPAPNTQMRVIVLASDAAYAALVPLRYTAKAGKKGDAKGP